MLNLISGLKDPVSAVTHIIGALASIFGLVILVVRAAGQRKPWHVVAFAIYGASLIALYTASSLYHSLTLLESATLALEKLDHAMVYFLIAGTYTPVCLTVLRSGWGWSLFGVNWSLAIAGIVLKLVFTRPPFTVIAVLFVFYLVMGWLIVIAWKPLVRVLPKGGVLWLVWGGVFYTVGTLVLNMKFLQLAPGFGAHEIWHFFVMAGSFCHYQLMWRYVSLFPLKDPHGGNDLPAAVRFLNHPPEPPPQNKLPPQHGKRFHLGRIKSQGLASAPVVELQDHMAFCALDKPEKAFVVGRRFDDPAAESLKIHARHHSDLAGGGGNDRRGLC